jgi:hypothetical protein
MIFQFQERTQKWFSRLPNSIQNLENFQVFDWSIFFYWQKMSRKWEKIELRT